jgi:hypothetical protein
VRFGQKNETRAGVETQTSSMCPAWLMEPIHVEPEADRRPALTAAVRFPAA